MFFRKHWEKILLAVFAIFWSGCENVGESPTLYGCGPCGCDGNGCEVVPDYGAPYDEQTELYGPPCVFNGTCDDESVSNENPGQE